jgi:rhodanese-related sulfurtransferase
MNQGNMRFIALFSVKETGGEAYLSELSLPVRELRYVSLPSLGIKNVPTLAILDRNGVVTDMWVGKLSPGKESDVMNKLNLKNTRSPDEWSIDEAEFSLRIANHDSIVLLDVRDRAVFAQKHKDGARNIPLDELPVRAVNELPASQTIVVYGSDQSEADLAYSILDTHGFDKVLILIPDAAQPEKEPF